MSSMENSIEQAVRLAGGQTAMANALGVSPQAVQQWEKRGIVPADKCPEIEKLLNGQVRCEALNTKVDWAYIRSCGAKRATNSNNNTPPIDRRKAGRRATDKPQQQ